MNFQRGVFLRKAMSIGSLTAEARDAGYAVFVLPTAGVTDRASFFSAIRAVMPLDPPLESARSWDALSDSMWEGLRGLASDRILILWPNARGLAEASLPDFEIAINILEDVSNTLFDPQLTKGQPKSVTVLYEAD